MGGNWIETLPQRGAKKPDTANVWQWSQKEKAFKWLFFISDVSLVFFGTTKDFAQHKCLPPMILLKKKCLKITMRRFAEKLLRSFPLFFLKTQQRCWMFNIFEAWKNVKIPNTNKTRFVLRMRTGPNRNPGPQERFYNFLSTTGEQQYILCDWFKMN